MRGWRGFLAGSLGLIVLEIVVTSSQATGRVSGLFTGIASATDWLLDTATPGIPDRSASTTAVTTAVPASTSSSLVKPPAMAGKTPGYVSTNPPATVLV